MPKRNKQKFIEKYVKKAFKDGLTSQEIEDDYLREYMISKLKQEGYCINATKITHYRNNLFLFKGHSCVTILEMPERAQDAVDNSIYITKIRPFVNCLDETRAVKKWLLENGERIDKSKDIKRCIVNIPKNLSYTYLMNYFPLNAIKYIKNDSTFKNIIISNNKKRNLKIKNQYYFIYAMLLLFPKNQILKLQDILKNIDNSIFSTLNIDIISQKQLDLAYKQLYILYGENLYPKYNNFNVNDNTCYDIINDYLNSTIKDYIKIIVDVFKDKK